MRLLTMVAGLPLLAVLALPAAIAGFFLAPLSNWWSRRQEWQADRFACALHRERSRGLVSPFCEVCIDQRACDSGQRHPPAKQQPPVEQPPTTSP